MITGFNPGTKVKWSEENTLTTGTIEKVFHESGTVKLNGQKIDFRVDASPVYLIKHHSGRHLLLPHSEVFLKNMNFHT